VTQHAASVTSASGREDAACEAPAMATAPSPMATAPAVSMNVAGGARQVCQARKCPGCDEGGALWALALADAIRTILE